MWQIIELLSVPQEGAAVCSPTQVMFSNAIEFNGRVLWGVLWGTLASKVLMFPTSSSLLFYFINGTPTRAIFGRMVAP